MCGVRCMVGIKRNDCKSKNYKVKKAVAEDNIFCAVVASELNGSQLILYREGKRGEDSGEESRERKADFRRV